MSEKKEIMIVEDEEVLLKLQSLLLTSRGYEVKGVSSGKMALTCLAKMRPDLVVLDISKEEMDVFEVCRQIKSEACTKDLPVIIMSSKNSSEDLAKGEKAGADEYITKPFKSSLLVDAIKKLLSASKEPTPCFS